MRTNIKFIKKANMWCLTFWDEKDKQKQEWFSTKEEAEIFKQDYEKNRN